MYIYACIRMYNNAGFIQIQYDIAVSYISEYFQDFVVIPECVFDKGYTLNNTFLQIRLIY